MGVQEGAGEDGAAQSRSSAPLGCGHSPDTQTQASALCCTPVSLWAKSTSKHKLSGREGKTKGHLWLLGSLGEPGEPHSLQWQGIVGQKDWSRPDSRELNFRK